MESKLKNQNKKTFKTTLKQKRKRKKHFTNEIIARNKVSVFV